jgi:hypothetical protein
VEEQDMVRGEEEDIVTGGEMPPFPLVKVTEVVRDEGPFIIFIGSATISFVFCRESTY